MHPSKLGANGVPTMWHKVVRFPPAVGPEARPGRTAESRLDEISIAPPDETALKNARLVLSVPFPRLVTTGPWKVIRPHRARKVHNKVEMSLNPDRIFGRCFIDSKSRKGRIRILPYPPLAQMIAFMDGSTNIRLTCSARWASEPAR